MSSVLSDLGWIAEVIVNQRTGRVLDGHLRIELAIARGEPTVPVTLVDIDEAEEPMAVATFDQLGALATLDPTVLDALLREVSTDDPAIALLLETVARNEGLELAPAGLGDPELVPALPTLDECFVQRGDLYLLGEPPHQHHLLCGDATSAADVKRLLGGAAPTLLATDPPYGVRLDSSWRDALGARRGRGRGVGSLPGPTGSAPGPRPVAGRTAGHRYASIAGDTRADWSEAFALAASLEVGYVWHAAAHAAEVAQGLAGIGFEIASQIVWDKERFVLGRAWYHWGHEPCWVVRRVGRRVAFYGSRDQSTVWRAPSPTVTGALDPSVDHPTQKPVLLWEIPIANHLRPGEALYDPFVGSGTALIAAERLGRVCYAMELEPVFCQQALRRWEQFTGRRARLATDTPEVGRARP